MLPLVYLPSVYVFGVYRLQRISTFRMSARTRTSTIHSIPRGIPFAIPSIARAIPFNGFTSVVREPHVRSYIVSSKNHALTTHLTIQSFRI